MRRTCRHARRIADDAVRRGDVRSAPCWGRQTGSEHNPGMARLSRLSLPGRLHHILQRGNNRQAVVLDDEDRAALLQALRDEAAQAQVAVHAYVLMDNHVHLLATPATAEGVSQMMQGLGRRYVRAFNRRHGRSGTLFEGRYRSTLLQPEPHLLPAMAYLDLNPVRTGQAASAADWPWSSHGHYAGLRQSDWLQTHPLYWALGNTPFDREAAYLRLFEQGLGSSQVKVVEEAVLKGWPLGSDAFKQALEQKMQRQVLPAKRGRPRKIVAATDAVKSIGS